MNVSFRQIKAFLHVARLGNFTRAADHMHITQAGLSIMMRELESQLNCRLFDRTTRTVSLTLAGEQLLPVARRLVDDLEVCASQLGAITAEARQTLRVGVTPLVSSNILPSACQLFRRSHPKVTLKIIDTGPRQVQELVESGELDFGLGAFFKPTTGVDVVPLFSYQLMWISPPKQGIEHLDTGPAPTLSQRHKAAWTALKHVRLISLPPDNKIQQVIEEHLAQIGRGHEERPTFNNIETLIAMVAAGEGSAVVPSYAITACLRYGVDTAILFKPNTPLNFYRISKRGRVANDAMHDFINDFIVCVPV